MCVLISQLLLPFSYEMVRSAERLYVNEKMEATGTDNKQIADTLEATCAHVNIFHRSTTGKQAHVQIVSLGTVLGVKHGVSQRHRTRLPGHSVKSKWAVLCNFVVFCKRILVRREIS